MRKNWRSAGSGFFIRSLLFVPGNRADMMEKAMDLPADALILDLEDS